MKVVLAEKPSVARDIAAYLGADKKRDGWLEGNGYQVTWAYGHLVTLKTPDQYDASYKSWSVEVLPIIPEQFELTLVKEQHARRQFPIVKRLFLGATELICATDAGREGELIFRYILECTGCRCRKISRLWLQSLTPQAIRAAFDNLRPASHYDSLFQAARCRSEADWIVGINATRNYTARFRDSGVLWSVGRVQTPVLAMIVDRDDEIRTFKPTPFWELITRYRGVNFRCQLERCTTESAAQALLQRILGEPLAITGVEQRPLIEKPPYLYDLTGLQRDMNRRYGLSAADTLSAAQSLYEKKAITYPRTDSAFLSSDMREKVPGILRELQASRPEDIARLDLTALPFTGRIINDSKITDHHAIIPTGKSITCSGMEGKVYEALVTRLIAAFYPPCRKQQTTVNAISNEIPFRARGVRVVDPGWTILYPAPAKKRQREGDEEESDTQELPAFSRGESGPHEPTVRQGETQPPHAFTENSLLALMETAGRLVDDDQLKEALKEKGIGTPATRAAIIETLLTRGYIDRQGKAMRATDLGRYLIAIVQDAALKSPELTGEWESRLNQIQQKHLASERFMADIVEYARELIRGSSETPAVTDSLGRCPRCGKDVIKGRTGYGCSGWRDGCGFVVWPTYEGMALSDLQLRTLLQQHVLREPVRLPSGDDVLLYMARHGCIVHVPLPARNNARRGKGGRKASASKDVKSAGKAGRRTSGKTTAPAGESLGACPLCGKEVIDQKKSYSCSGWREGCGFTIWKSIAGKKIAASTARSLLTKGITSELKGFKSRQGQPFSARLHVVDGKVEMRFPDRQEPKS